MKQYEYDVIPSSRHLTGEFLSAKGEQGWELVSHTYMPDIVVAHIYTFKREIVETEKEPGWSDFMAEYLREETARYKDVPTVVVNQESEWQRRRRLEAMKEARQKEESYTRSLKELNRQKEERELIKSILADRSNANGHDKEGNPKYIYDGYEYILNTSCNKILSMSFEKIK